MSLVYHYRLFPTGQSILTLGGRWVRPRPIVRVTVIGPSNTVMREALLDTGADDTLLRESLAFQIGVDMSNAPSGLVTRIGQQPISVRYSEVSLRLASAYGPQQREWRAWVGFTPAPLKRALLGFAGCLQFFTSAFHGDREQVVLDANSLFPGP